MEVRAMAQHGSGVIDRRTVPSRYIGAVRVACGLGTALAATAALGPTFGALAYLFPAAIGLDPEMRGSGTWLDYGNFGIAAVAWTITGLLGWAALGLEGPHPTRARRAGLVGAALICVSGLGIALAPLTDPVMASVGGWGQPWMPEILLGAFTIAGGAALAALLHGTRDR
jgi:hypothetical protein